mgnify:CR=1 FL=1
MKPNPRATATIGEDAPYQKPIGASPTTTAERNIAKIANFCRICRILPRHPRRGSIHERRNRCEETARNRRCAGSADAAQVFEESSYSIDRIRAGAIGTGLFYGSSESIQLAGPAILLAYLIGGLAIFLIVRALSEMAVEDPKAGAFSYYATQYWSKRAGLFPAGITGSTTCSWPWWSWPWLARS